MKKILSVLFATALLASAPLFADGYGFGWGGDIAFAINKGPTTSFLAVKDSSMSFSLNTNATGGSTVNFGVYTFDSDFNITSEKVYSDFGNSDGVSVSQNFKAGDMVGFWVEVDGEKRFSVHEMNNKGVTQDGWWKEANGDLVFGFETNAPVFGGKDNLDFLVNITGQAPTGQPLPGVFATVCVAGLVGFGARRMRPRQ